jgi:hypothetical protein
MAASVGVPHADHQPGVPRSFNTRRGAKQFGRNGDELRMTTRRRNEFCEHIRGRQVNPFQRMHAWPHRTDERSFEVNSQDFGARISGQILRADVPGDSLGAFANRVRVCGDRGGKERSGAVRGDHFSDRF